MTGSKRMTMMGPLGAVMLAAVLGACSEHADPERHDTPPKPVRVAPVQPTDAARSFYLTGTTRAAQRATLAFQISGNLASRPVQLGQHVAAGDVIATLDNPGAKPRVAAARARLAETETRLAQARRDAERVQRLSDHGAATEEELEQARATRDALAAGRDNARAQLRSASRTLDDTRLTAPVAGTIEKLFFESGEFVPAGRPVAALSGSGVMEVEIGVPENLLDEVEIGQKTELRLPLLNNRKLSGTVTEFAASALGPGQLFPAVITLDAGDGLRAGLTVEWRLHASEPRELTVPVAAVASPGGGNAPRVYRVVDGKARAVPVRLGAVIGERVIIEGDLAAGQPVIVLGLNNLTDGRAVAVLH